MGSLNATAPSNKKDGPQIHLYIEARLKRRLMALVHQRRMDGEKALVSENSIMELLLRTYFAAAQEVAAGKDARTVFGEAFAGIYFVLHGGMLDEPGATDSD